MHSGSLLDNKEDWHHDVVNTCHWRQDVLHWVRCIFAVTWSLLLHHTTFTIPHWQHVLVPARHPPTGSLHNEGDHQHAVMGGGGMLIDMVSSDQTQSIVLGPIEANNIQHPSQPWDGPPSTGHGHWSRTVQQCSRIIDKNSGLWCRRKWEPSPWPNS